MQIYELMPKVAKSIGAIKKSGRNDFDGYNFRGIDDVLNAVGPALIEHGVTMTHSIDKYESGEIQSSKGKAMVRVLLLQTTTWTAPDGSSVSTQTLGEAMDRGDKAANKAMSAATKYAIFRTFAVPTEEQDADADSPEIAPKNGSARPPKGNSNDPLSVLDAELDAATTHDEVKAIGLKVGALPDSKRKKELHAKASKLYKQLKPKEAA